jgi:hypothetical protein
MKFGRTIKTSLYSEWSSKYLRYSELKKEIKKRIANNGGTWTDKDEDEFVALLREELDKVYDFQKLKVSIRGSLCLGVRCSQRVLAAPCVRLRSMMNPQLTETNPFPDGLRRCKSSPTVSSKLNRKSTCSSPHTTTPLLLSAPMPMLRTAKSQTEKVKLI